MLPRWQLVRDVIDGDTTVKAKADDYLPMLSAQEGQMYEAYKARAVFLEITGRTSESFLGFIYRKDPDLTYPDLLQEFIDDATLTGLSWYDYLKQRLHEVIDMGRAGTLVEFDDIAGRPFVKPYKCEDIINWKVGRVGKKVTLTLLMLSEESDVWIDDGSGEAQPDAYETKKYQQWRELRLMTDSLDGVPYVVVKVWRKKRNSTATQASKTSAGTSSKGKRGTGPTSATIDEFFQVGSDVIPTRRGVPLNEITFVFHGPNNFMPDIDQIPMEGIAKLNLALYRTSADLENGRHFTGLPTLYAIGFDDEEIILGSTNAVVCSDPKPGVAIGFVEVKGDFAALTKGQEEKKMDMASLGARLLDYQKKDIEAYETARMRQTGETVTLGNISIAGTQAGSRILQIATWWVTAADDVNAVAEAKIAFVELNTEFVATKLPADLWAAANAARGTNLISAEAYFNILRDGEVYPPDWTFEQEQDAIAKTMLPDITGGTPGGPGGGGTGPTGKPPTGKPPTGKPPGGTAPTGKPPAGA
jgi:hypothetical protein